MLKLLEVQWRAWGAPAKEGCKTHRYLPVRCSFLLITTDRYPPVLSPPVPWSLLLRNIYKERPLQVKKPRNLRLSVISCNGGQ